MLKFSASVFMFFNELPILDRYRAIAEAGFKAVEYPFPYQLPTEQLAEQLDKYDLKQVLINSPQGDWEAGDRGLAALLNRETEFQDSIEQALNYAMALDCKQISVPAGSINPSWDKEKVAETYHNNITFAAKRFAENGITLLIEAINQNDMPNFYISKSDEAINKIKQLNQPNVGMLFDIYHIQRSEGEVTNNLKKCFPYTSHIQIADNPGRHEPGTGELNYQFLFKAIEDLGYQGWVGCEYWPENETNKGLSWYKPYKV